MLFAEVIPVLRTPLGIEGFDYSIPDGLTVHVGDLVITPFRRGTIVGLVSAIKTTSAFATQALPIKQLYANLHFPNVFVDLIKATAERTFSSRPSVLKSWVRNLPKRPKLLEIITTKQQDHGIKGDWQTGALQELIHRAQTQSQTKRVLIVTPWLIRAETLQRALPTAHILHSDMSDGDAFSAWTQFLSRSTGCLITTKIGVWLACMSDAVFLDEPEQDDHKQDELSPRYDARKVLLFCAQQGATRVESLGLTPPLHAQTSAPPIEGRTLIHIHHPQAKSVIPLLQADSLAALLEHEGPRIIVHAIRGSLARLTCRDCQWQAECPACGSGLGADKSGAICRRCHKSYPMPETCPTCGGIDLSRSLPGIERLQAQWTKELAETEIQWRDTTAKELETPLPVGCLMVVTEAAFLGAGEDIRRRERQCIAVRRLADRVHQVNGTLILQCREDMADLIKGWLTTEGMAVFVERERHERQTFGYPPAKRLVKIIIKGSEETAQTWLTQTKKRLVSTPLNRGEWRGPFPAEYQPAPRGARQIIHLVLPADTNEKELINALTPCGKQAIIDLDPIAFLR